MLSDALEFPRADDDWLETVLIGGVLSLLGFLVLPAIVVNGYLLRVMEAAVDGEATPPRFDDWADLFIDGLLVWIVQFVYVGIPTFVFAMVFLSVAAVGIAAGTVGDQPAVWAGIVGLLVGLAAVALLVIAVYLMPAAVANFARTGEFEAAFHLRTVARAAFTADYFVAVLLAIVVGIVLGLIGSLLTIILVGIFVLFYLEVVVYHLFAQGFAAGLDLERGAGTPDDAA